MKLENNIRSNTPDTKPLEALRELLGLECWSISAGEGTGSIFKLSLGGKIERKQPIANPHLSELVSNYESAYSLMVECAWRLDDSGKPVTGSNDPNTNNGPMVQGLKRLIGTQVTYINCFGPANDLQLIFNDSLILNIFCDIVNNDEDDENYSLLTPKGCLQAGPGAFFEFEPN